jgi:hypothetical protein
VSDGGFHAAISDQYRRRNVCVAPRHRVEIAVGKGPQPGRRGRLTPNANYQIPRTFALF